MDRLVELVRLHRMGRSGVKVARLLGMSPNTETGLPVRSVTRRTTQRRRRGPARAGDAQGGGESSSFRRTATGSRLPWSSRGSRAWGGLREAGLRYVGRLYDTIQRRARCGRRGVS